MSKFIKPNRPAPYRAGSLWRQCKFAQAWGWDKGRTSTNVMPSVDDIFRATTSSYSGGRTQVIDAGRSLLDVDSQTPIRFTDIGGRLAIGHGFSAMVVVKPTAMGTGFGSVHPFGKGTTLAVGSYAWRFAMLEGAGPIYEWHGLFTDGLVNVDANAGFNAAVGRTDTMIMVYDRANLTIYSDRITTKGRKGSIASVLAVQNNSAFPIGLMTPDTSGSPEDSFTLDISMSAFWTRPLVSSEIGRLLADPFVMWHDYEDAEGMVPAAPVAAGDENDCCRCPEWMTGPMAIDNPFI